MSKPVIPPYKHGQSLYETALVHDEQLILFGRIAASHANMETNLIILSDAFHKGWPSNEWDGAASLTLKRRCKVLRKSSRLAIVSASFDKDMTYFTDHLYRIHRARNVVLHGLYSQALDGKSTGYQLISAELDRKKRIFWFDTKQLEKIHTQLAYAAGAMEMLWRGKLSPWFSSQDTSDAQRVLAAHLNLQPRIPSNSEALPLDSLL